MVLSYDCRSEDDSTTENLVAFRSDSETFQKLSEKEQQDLIEAAFDHWLQRTKNVEYEVTSFLFFGSLEAELPLKVPTAEEERWSSFRQRFRWLDGDYHIDRTAIGVGGFSKAEPVGEITAIFESGTSTGKILRDYRAEGQKYGRIEGALDDSLVEEHRFSYWLSGRKSVYGYYFIDNAVRNIRGLQVLSVEADDSVNVRVPWDHDRNGIVTGAYELKLDLRKGFLPTRVSGKWTEKNDWRTDEWIVLFSRQVGDLWFPTELQQRRGSSMSSTGRAAIHQLTIDKIKVGTVTRDQMQLEFPEGIFVVDAKQGESYIVGPGGVPTAKTLLIGESAVAAAEFEKEMAERFFAERST